MVSTENVQSGNIVWTQQTIFRNIYPYTNTYMHAIMITEKRSCESEEEWRGVWERAWREERERRNVIKL